MQSKSISTSSAYAFKAKNRYSYIFNLMDTGLYFTFKRDAVSNTSKSVLPFPCLKLFSSFKRIKNHLRTCGNQLAVDESFCKVMILFFS